jgi:hypothetical protein
MGEFLNGTVLKCRFRWDSSYMGQFLNLVLDGTIIKWDNY